MTTEYVVDLSPADADLAEVIARALNERIVTEARATAGLDPIDSLPPYWVIAPGEREDYPDGLQIERIAEPIPHNTDPNKRAYAWGDAHRAALLDGSTVAYLNTWGSENGYPGLGGQAQAMRAQLIQTLPAAYIAEPEPMTAVADPHLRPRRRA
jgi:hypothetical protein